MSASSTQDLNGFPVPVGTILMWSGDSANPVLTQKLEETAGFLVCDGRILNIADYPELYDVIGTTYNNKQPAVVPAAGQFVLPNIPDPDGAGTYRGLLCGDTQAGVFVPATAGTTPIGSAQLTLTPQMLPTFPLVYDGTNPYAIVGSYVCDNGSGGVQGTNVYSKSNTYVRNPSGQNFVRDDITYSSVGGLGDDTVAPQVSYSNGTGSVAPIDITASLVSGSYIPPTFNIVPIIRAKGGYEFNEG